MLAGSALGIAIGTHIFHSYCDPSLSESCRRDLQKFKMLDSIQGCRRKINQAQSKRRT